MNKFFSTIIIVISHMLVFAPVQASELPEEATVVMNAQNYDWDRFHGPGTPAEQLASIDHCRSSDVRTMVTAEIVRFNAELEARELSVREKANEFVASGRIDRRCVFILTSNPGTEYLVIRSRGADYLITYATILLASELDGVGQEKFMTTEWRHRLTPAEELLQ